MPATTMHVDPGQRYDAATLTPDGLALFAGFDNVVRTASGGALYLGAAYVTSIAARGPADFIVSDGGVVIHISAGGPAEVLDDEGAPLVGVQHVGRTLDGAYVAVGVDGEAFFAATEPGGLVWTRKAGPSELLDCDVGDLGGASASEVDLRLAYCLAAQDAGVWSHRAGTWTQALPGDVSGWAIGADGVRVALQGGSLWQASGDTWTEVGAAPDGAGHLAAVSAHEVYAVGGQRPEDLSPALMRFDGSRWAPMRRGEERTEPAFFSSDYKVLADRYGLTLFGEVSGAGELGQPYLDEWRRDPTWDGVAP
jgi:hypothetical protein